MDFRIGDYLSSPAMMAGIWRKMKKTPYLPPAQARIRLLSDLREICSYAQEHVPFYKEWFADAHFDPQLLYDLEYFERLPLLDKDVVRANADRMVSDEIDRLGAVECETSGSTGTPLKFYLDRRVNAASFLLFYRAWSMAPGWHIWDNEATISGYAEGVWNYNPVNRVLYLSSFHLDDEHAREFYDLIRKYHVKFIRGYPSSLYRFAQLLEQNNLELSFPVMFSGAETLLPYQREYIEKAFHGRLIDHYTHWERTASVLECMQGRLHAQNDFGYHEITDENGKRIDGGVGHLVCTGLYNRAMPLIRYDTRDLAEWGDGSPCPCGCTFPVISRITGRIEDIVVTPEGRYIGRLDAAFKYNDRIRLACIHQPSVDRIIVKICPLEGFDLKQEEPLLTSELRKRVGDTIRIDYELITADQIPYTKRGKVRFVTSDVLTQMQTTHLAEEEADHADQ